MHKIFSINVFAAVVLLSLFSSKEISISNIMSKDFNSNKTVKKNLNYGIFDKTTEWTEQKLSSMTLREKIAQMIISNSDGYVLDESSAEFQRIQNLIVNEKIGGLIFFKGNSGQEAGLINKFQSMSETPLLISADFERGTRMRLDDGSLFPSNMALGATRNPELAYRMGLQM